MMCLYMVQSPELSIYGIPKEGGVILHPLCGCGDGMVVVIY